MITLSKNNILICSVLALCVGGLFFYLSNNLAASSCSADKPSIHVGDVIERLEFDHGIFTVFYRNKDSVKLSYMGCVSILPKQVVDLSWKSEK